VIDRDLLHEVKIKCAEIEEANMVLELRSKYFMTQPSLLKQFQLISLPDRLLVEELEAYKCSFCDTGQETKLLPRPLALRRGDIKVFLRIKPLPKNENVQSPLYVLNDQTVELHRERQQSMARKLEKKAYHFDHIFRETADNAEVYEKIQGMVHSMMEDTGPSVCIFAYGQSGSGKTHTMSSEDGIVARSVGQLLQSVTDRAAGLVTIKCSAKQIYCGIVIDLLSGSRTITDLANAKEVLAEAQEGRAKSTTILNAVSSRSHMIVILELYLQGRARYFTIVDLAGSESINSSNAKSGDSQLDSDRRRDIEGRHIRTDNLELGNCIRAMRSKGTDGPVREHIWRNSKVLYTDTFDKDYD